MQQPVILPFSAAYQQQVIDLILPIQQIEFGVPVTIDDQPDLLQIPSFYQQRCGNFWIALMNDQVVGSIGLIDIGHRAAAIRKMFVRANYRGSGFGLGLALLNTAVDWCVQQDIQRLYLGTVDQLKAAQRFYEKNGFVRIPAAQLPDYFPRMPVDTQFFQRTLAV